MFIGYFTERPYQRRDRPWYGGMVQDLQISNSEYDPVLGAQLYNRYLDEKAHAEDVGFDGLILNEHHSTPFCMGGVLNVEAAILARMTSKAKIVLMGNVLPIWDDPLWLAEQLAEIDMISNGRLVTGWVRGTGRESFAHNAQPAYNWERFQEAHDFILKAWTDPGPFRWEGEHYDYRYVNPWMRPLQSPHPPIWIPGVYSKNTVEWAARHRYPYFMLSTALEATRQSFEFYSSVAEDEGFEAGPEHRGYLFKVHVDETEELAYETGRKYLEGPGNLFLEGSPSLANRAVQQLPGLVSRNHVLPTGKVAHVAAARGRAVGPAPKQLTGAARRAAITATYEKQLAEHTIISGTPDVVIKKVRHVMETLRPGSIGFWDGDGDMTHDDATRSLRLMGSEVLPAVHEIARELGLSSPFEVDPNTANLAVSE
ncbi:LLM class flavin-dependent oxidoreductase [Nocardioides sp.]|uniref:LLM class flavin-dependent oxidoreductase n=1 Tax=Nocardioides sp. TaxID=35761 RepID=UPI003D0DC0B7